jgi:hypothetical protein
VIKISFGRTRDFRVKMWGTSSPEDKLAGDLGNVIGATSIGGRRSDFFTAEKLAPGNLGLLQQYLPQPDPCIATKGRVQGVYSTPSTRPSIIGIVRPVRRVRSIAFIAMMRFAMSRAVIW